jgi:pentatricopeptide repeat protein
MKNSSFKQNQVVQTALIHFYGKCGQPEEALKVFHEMDNCDLVTWNAIINVCGTNGRGIQALTLFQQMQEQGIKPNHITFVALLSACSHSGLVEEALHHFELIGARFRITPTTEHFNCIVDALARSGKLDEAENFIQKIPEPNIVTWMSLLGTNLFSKILTQLQAGV